MKSKKNQKVSCKTCINYHCCSAIIPSPDCWMGKKTTSMKEKIRRREEIAAFRKSVAKYM